MNDTERELLDEYMEITEWCWENLDTTEYHRFFELREALGYPDEDE